MSEMIVLLLELLDRGFDQSSWHGPNLASSLRGIDSLAATKTVHGRKSIWQQTMHAAYWKKRALNRLIGTQKIPQPSQNWPKNPRKMTKQQWKGDLLLLRSIHAKWRAAIVELNDQTLTPKHRKLILGVAAHDVYHAGQIQMLRRMMRAK